MAYQVQVRGEWADSVSSDWRPAVDGTLNQTGESAADASTFASHEEASDALDNVILPEITSDPDDGDPRDNAPKFRIVEVQS